MSCLFCDDEGWVCETHPDHPLAAGMPAGGRYVRPLFWNHPQQVKFPLIALRGQAPIYKSLPVLSNFAECLVVGPYVPIIGERLRP